MKKPKSVDLLQSRTIKMKPRSYQPSEAEKEQEMDMPGADIETVQSAIFRPIKIEEGEMKK